MNNENSDNDFDLKDLIKFKIIPRNLTARSDYLVKGNPVTTRPESGVDNCYPGLEFDQRNLDKGFFHGISVEFHRDDGAILTKISTEFRDSSGSILKTDNFPLYLWALLGRTSLDQSEENPPYFYFAGLNGMEVWRRIHDLLPGKILIVLGPTPGKRPPDIFEPNLGLMQQLEDLRDSGENFIQVDQEGKIEFAILVGERSKYLDEYGVIDINFEPGELTRTLCAPWQYDFRDCGCFYWAASKPDLVSSSDGKNPYLNFQRKDRNEPPPLDQPDLRGRRAQELGYSALISEEWWNKLPVVINDQETEKFVPSKSLVNLPLMTREQVINELKYLATVEHALLVEYLYAHYSLNAPLEISDETDVQTKLIFAAAKEIFMIAVDEMRHFRWVNEALSLLQQSPSIGRAEFIGRSFNRPFELKVLTPEQLTWFIDVERPSQAMNEGDLDGMYVRLHTSIDQQPDLFPERDRLVHLIKLIIDEGQDHYVRFTSVQQHLNGLATSVYLRTLNDPESNSPESNIQELSDANYSVILIALLESFRLGDKSRGLLIEQTRKAMFNMHETNHLLAKRGINIRFKLPSPMPTFHLEPKLAIEQSQKVHSFYNDTLEVAERSFKEKEQELVDKHKKRISELFVLMEKLINENN